ncbi:MAG: hypothetical protein J7M14_01530 [Planctomycetes bacterium]|nr:hypothetical protein [Planctomycetota bacterium]
MKIAVYAALLGLTTVAGGCANWGHGPPRPVAAVDGIEMRVNPIALNWDGLSGADGLLTTISLYRKTPMRAVTVSGTLELLLFEGAVAPGYIEKAQPIETWSFSSEQLAEHVVRDMVGWSYVLRLGWTGARPQASSVTLVARYRPPGGQWIYSAPNSSITIDEK